MTSRASRGSDLARVVVAEWTKFRTVRSSFWTLLTTAALTVGVGAAFVPFLVDSFERSQPTEPGARVAAREGWWFAGLHFGILGIAILGVLVASSEYGTGTIRASLTAVPSRGRVFVAKVASFGAISLVTGIVQGYVAFMVARPLLAARSIAVPLADPAALRGVVMAALAVLGAGLLGLGTGLLIRHTAGAIGALVAVLWVLTGLALLLPDNWSDVRNALPADAMYAMFTPQPDTLTPATASAVFFGYVVVVLGVAGTLLVRRDA